jgi:hypothetical protein
MGSIYNNRKSMGEMKRMKKKAFFVSLSALLILIIIIASITINEKNINQEKGIEVSYNEHKYVVDYIKDVENIYIPSMLQFSQKKALIFISESVAAGKPKISDPLYADLENVIITGIYSGSSMGIENTLPELTKRDLRFLQTEIDFDPSKLTLDITKLYQKDEWTICTDSEVSFEIKSDQIIWKTTKKKYSTCVNINGLTHPHGPLGTTDKKVQGLPNIFWLTSTNADYCYLQSICSITICNCNDPTGNLLNGVCPLGDCCNLFYQCP